MTHQMHTRTRVGGPSFEDLWHGRVFDAAPALTLTDGHAAVYQALFGDRMRLPLDAELCRAVTGRREPLVHPLLVCAVAIGQTTDATERVRANLFYRCLTLPTPVHVGDTLSTTAEVVALKQNERRPGKPATGLAVLRVVARNQRGEPVLTVWRCPMVPLRDEELDTGHRDAFDAIPDELDPQALASAIPGEWRLDFLRERCSRPHFDDLEPGAVFEIEGRDTVTAAPEFARLTLNIAAVHTDAASAGGRRLVFGGHTISMACARALRAVPAIATIVGWRSCDHTGPVHEGDVLRTELTVEAVHDAHLADLRAVVFAREGDGSERPVLDWRFVAVVA